MATGRLDAHNGIGRRIVSLAAGVLIVFGLGGCVAPPPAQNAGYFSEWFAGVVLASPANCVRVTQPTSLAVAGLLCLQHPLGPAGSCVHGMVSNGGTTTDGITRLPASVPPSGQRLPAVKCRPSPQLAAYVQIAPEIIGVVWTDPQCLAVALPYLGSHDGLICAARPIGRAGECVQASDYHVSRIRSGDPFDSVISIQRTACAGLRRW
jgi:hypothetical protein